MDRLTDRLRIIDGLLDGLLDGLIDGLLDGLWMGSGWVLDGLIDGLLDGLWMGSGWVLDGLWMGSGWALDGLEIGSRWARNRLIGLQNIYLRTIHYNSYYHISRSCMYRRGVGVVFSFLYVRLLMFLAMEKSESRGLARNTKI
jgi:hypothetical protein